MLGECVFAVMDRHDSVRMEVFDCTNQLIRKKVDIGPVFIVLSVFKNGQTDAGMLLGNFRKKVVIPAVTSDIDSL